MINYSAASHGTLLVFRRKVAVMAVPCVCRPEDCNAADAGRNRARGLLLQRTPPTLIRRI